MDTTIRDHQANHTNHGGIFLMGLVAGSAIGAGLAIVFAPRLAAELRQRAADSATDLLNAASDRLQDVANRVAGAVDGVADDVTKKGQAVRDNVADVVGRRAHDVSRGALEVARTAREVEQFAMASKTGQPTRS